jgi:hypothetical protein
VWNGRVKVIHGHSVEKYCADPILHVPRIYSELRLKDVAYALAELELGDEAGLKKREKMTHHIGVAV